MKAKRLKSGWALRLTDSEMSILRCAVAEIQAGWSSDAEIGHLSPAEKAAWRKSFCAIKWPEIIDDSR